MERKQGGDEKVAPEGGVRFRAKAHQGLQEEEQEDGVGAVEGDVDHMRATGVQAEDLAVQHMGKPGERMPIIGLAVNEGPFHAGPSQALEDGGVVVDVVVVVIGDELVIMGGPIDGQRDGNEERTGEEVPSVGYAGWRRGHARILGGNGRMPRFFTQAMKQDV
jgi:hypothetical protein